MAADRHVPGQPTNGSRTIYDASGRAVASERVGDVIIDVTTADGVSSSTLVSAGAVYSSSSTVYDVTGRVESSKGADNQTTRYTYDTMGRRSVVTDALSNETKFFYDGLGRQTTVRDALGPGDPHDVRRLGPGDFKDHVRRRNVRLDRLRRWAAKLPRRTNFGRTTNFEYDVAGRLTAVVQPAVDDPEDATADLVRPRYEYEYNKFGDLLVRRDARGARRRPPTTRSAAARCAHVADGPDRAASPTTRSAGRSCTSTSRARWPRPSTMTTYACRRPAASAWAGRADAAVPVAGILRRGAPARPPRRSPTATTPPAGSGARPTPAARRATPTTSTAARRRSRLRMGRSTTPTRRRPVDWPARGRTPPTPATPTTTGDEARAFALADNRTAGLAASDLAELQRTTGELSASLEDFGLAEIGFGDGQVDEIRAGLRAARERRSGGATKGRAATPGNSERASDLRLQPGGIEVRGVVEEHQGSPHITLRWHSGRCSGVSSCKVPRKSLFDFSEEEGFLNDERFRTSPVARRRRRWWPEPRDRRE